MERRLIRIAEEIKTAVTAEVDRIAAAGMPATDKTGWAQLTEAFPTADQLLDEIQVLPHVWSYYIVTALMSENSPVS